MAICLAALKAVGWEVESERRWIDDDSEDDGYSVTEWTHIAPKGDDNE